MSLQPQSVYPNKRRTDATTFFGKQDAFRELDKLKWAMASLVDVITGLGSSEHEVASNVVMGLKARIDYLHDSFNYVLEQEFESETRRRVVEKLGPQKATP